MAGYCKSLRPLYVKNKLLIRTRYVGAEDGIYEYHVNIAGRKKFPSVVLR
jgi:hypothetical protein